MKIDFANLQYQHELYKDEIEEAILNVARNCNFIMGEEVSQLEKSLEEQIQIGMKLNVQGTPTIFDKDGKNIVWVNLLEKFGIEVK